MIQMIEWMGNGWFQRQEEPVSEQRNALQRLGDWLTKRDPVRPDPVVIPLPPAPPVPTPFRPVAVAKPAPAASPTPLQRTERGRDGANRRRMTPDPSTAGGYPTGQIKTRNPKGQPFGVDWAQIIQWAPDVESVAGNDITTRLVAPRLLAHIVIESQGIPTAIQRNPSNGDSFGLLQVVPRWWQAMIEALAERSFASHEAAGQAMITDPFLAIRCGSAVLGSFYGQFGSWDAASSGFFTGKPNWDGADTVNGTRGGDYKQCLNELIVELGVATPRPTPRPDPLPSNVGLKIAEVATAQVGKSYHNPPHWNDCSGFTASCVKQVTGETISPDSHLQATLGEPVSVLDIEPGDIILYDTQGGGEVRHGNAISHVAVAISGARAVSAMNEQQGVLAHDILSDYFRPLYKGTRRLFPTGGKPDRPKDDRADWVRHEVPGAPNGLTLPPWITVKVQLTPRGPNRSGRTLQPIGSVFHETGNTRSDAGAQMHATWQANGTPGHPDGKIGVHAYIENDLVIFTLPLNEQGVHAGDSRNQTTLGYELCVNSTRDAALSERTAMHLHAATLAEVVTPPTTARAAMWSHTTTACPAVINSSGRWTAVESAVDQIIASGAGGAGPRPKNYPGLDIPDAVFEALWVGNAKPDKDGPLTKWIIAHRHFVPIHDLIADGTDRYLVTATGVLRYRSGKIEEL